MDGVTSAIQTQLDTKWGTSGNASTISGTNFVGTTDNISLTFRTNAIKRASLDSVGVFSVDSSILVNGTMRIGRGGQKVATNTGVGTSTLIVNGTGGIQNTGVGYETLKANTTGDDNTAVGYSSLPAVTTASSNTAVGSQSLQALSNGGSFNTAVGVYALSTTNAAENTSIGYAAGLSNSSGAANVYIGNRAGQNMTTESNRLIINSFNTGSKALDTTNTLIYGAFSAFASHRKLTINAESVGVNTAGVVNASAVLEVTSTIKGFLPPRMTTAQRDAIGTPAAGLIIYNTTTAKLNVYTTAWEQITSL